MRLSPDEFVATYLTRDRRRGGRGRGGLPLRAQAAPATSRPLAELGLTLLDVPEVEGVSSTAIRDAVRDGDLDGAARMLGRPFELDGSVVAGDQRGGTLGYPTANIAMDPQLVCPRYGIYAGEALGHRAAVSIGTNPHYGGTERRIEPYLLDFEGDLYGKRLVVELWERLRDEAVFGSEEALVAQIARDVEATPVGHAPGVDAVRSRSPWCSGRRVRQRPQPSPQASGSAYSAARAERDKRCHVVADQGLSGILVVGVAWDEPRVSPAASSR